MYRLLVLLVALNFAYCYHHRPEGCSWRNIHHNCKHDFHRCRHYHRENHRQVETFPLTTFEEIASGIVKIDAAIKNLCDVNTINRTSEVYGNHYYILKYLLPEFKEANIVVKVMGRVIYTTANRQDGDLKSFKDIRILPDVVKVADARWIFENNTLKIFIPYKTNWRNVAVKDCNYTVTDNAIKIIPNMNGSPLGYRFSLPDDVTENYLDQIVIP